ncbi:MAG: methyltransferase domain-containing protein [Candidatus Limnocylindria bacterium]
MTIELPTTAETEKTPDALVARIFEASLGMYDVMSVYVGDQLGLYRSLRDGGPATAPKLASRAGIDARYAREWLEQQAATGFLEVDDIAAGADQRRYSLPESYVEPLLNLDSPYSIAPLARSLVACGKVIPQLMEAYRTGGGIDWSAYGPDMIGAQGDFNRPWLLNSFGSRILPAIPEVHERLAADPPARVADLACGVGWAALAIASAYPKVTVDGFDLDESSIELARENARLRGVSDRVTFERRDAAESVDGGDTGLEPVTSCMSSISG